MTHFSNSQRKVGLIIESPGNFENATKQARVRDFALARRMYVPPRSCPRRMHAAVSSTVERRRRWKKSACKNWANVWLLNIPLPPPIPTSLYFGQSCAFSPSSSTQWLSSFRRQHSTTFPHKFFKMVGAEAIRIFSFFGNIHHFMHALCRFRLLVEFDVFTVPVAVYEPAEDSFLIMDAMQLL
jgi:hypothetical protein